MTHQLDPAAPATLHGRSEATAEPPFDPPPQLGVLLVHGIGEQKRGETLAWAGDPLFSWLRAWQNKAVQPPGDRNRVYLDETHLAQPDPALPTAPPFARMYFAHGDRPGPHDPYWLLAESWWAATFGAPAFSDLVPWGLSIGPWLFDRVLRIPPARIAQSATMDKPAARWVRTVALVPVTAAAALLNVLFQFFVLILLPLGLLPGLRSAVLGLQGFLAGWIGDAYVMATSPVRMAAMRTQIREDVAWLAARGCRQVAVIAHSGGGTVAYDALAAAAPLPQGVQLLLITYGSSKSKIEIMRALLPNRTFLFALNPVARLIGMVFLVFGLVLTFPGDVDKANWVFDPAGLPWLLAGLAVFLGLTAWGWAFYTRIVQGKRTVGPPIPGVAWADYFADGDLVAESPTDRGEAVAADFVPRDGRPHPPEPGTVWTQEVSNLHSMLLDHTTYWENAEEFIPAVVQQMVDASWHPGVVTAPPGWLHGPHDGAVLEVAGKRRRARTLAYLDAGLLAILATLAAWLTLWPVLGTLGGRALARIGDLVPGLQPTPISGGLWPTLAGLLLVTGVVALWQQLVVFQTWRWWSREETAAMYARQVPLPAHHPPLPAQLRKQFATLNRRAWVFLGLLLVLPVAGLLLPQIATLLGTPLPEGANPFFFGDLWRGVATVLRLALAVATVVVIAGSARTTRATAAPAVEA